MRASNRTNAGVIAALLAVCLVCMVQPAFGGSIISWGVSQAIDGNDYIAIAAGEFHSLALKKDASVVGWGNNGFGQAGPPDGNNYKAIAAGAFHSLALKKDGSIVGWGANIDWNGNPCGQATPPAGDAFIAIAAGPWHSLALKRDGSIVGWGYNKDGWKGNWLGQATPPSGYNYIAIAAGFEYGLAIMACPYKLVGDWDGDCKVDFYDIALTTSNWLVDCYQTPDDPACTPR